MVQCVSFLKSVKVTKIWRLKEDEMHPFFYEETSHLDNPITSKNNGVR
ncbi:MAG: hypothetical protein ACTSQJ_05360 [Promethearchaeota archaeon]